MSKPTTSENANVVQFRRDIQEQLRSRIREAIQVVLDEEVIQALGCARYERNPARQGYRNGWEEREITTATGLQRLRVPRARLQAEDGSTKEFHSSVLPRYARRTREVDEAILGAYLAGANTRRVKKALAPLLGQEHMSKSSVSRVVQRLKEHFEEWRQRDLSEERYAILFLDAIHLKVRLARRVVSVPVLATLGVQEDGVKRLVSLSLAMSEASVHWSSVIEDLKARGLAAPLLLVSDGHKGLTKALETWPEAKLQRCTQHKWRNLVEHCPAHARGELRRDWHRIIRAKDGVAARKAYRDFVTKWSKLVPAVARSLEEAGEQLLSFYEFPKSMWKSLRTTNSLENLNREFRRRTKTQGSFSTEDAALILLYGLIASGQIQMRRIVGYKNMPKLLEELWADVA